MAPKSKRPKVAVAPNTLRSIFGNTTPAPIPTPTPHSTSIMRGSNSPQLQKSVLNQAATADSSHTPTSPPLFDSHSNRDPESHEENNENSSHNSDSSSHSAGNIGSHQRDKATSSRKYWTVNVIGEDEVITEEKLKAKDVWNLQGKKVIIEFNRFQQGIGEGAGLIGVWLGELASDVKVIPMNFTDWRGVPQTYKKKAVTDIERHFYFQSDAGMSWAMNSLRDKRKEFRNRLKSDYVKINSTRDEVMRTPATGIPQDEWNSLVDYWFSPKSKAMTERNTQNRKKLRFPHTGGSKSIARRTHEMELETGEHVGRGAAFIVTHKKKDGSYVNDDAKVMGEEIEKIMDEEVASGQINDGMPSTDDAMGQVLGKEHNGRVRGMGFGVCPSKVFSPSSCRGRGASTTFQGSVNNSSEVRSLKTELLKVNKRLEEEQAERERERSRISNVFKYLEQKLGIQLPRELGM